MNSFKHIPQETRFFYGTDALVHLGRELDRAGTKRALIICDPFLKEGGLLAQVETALGERCAGIFSDVVPRSPLPNVQQAAALVAELDADGLVVIGGGSSVVTARGANILAAEKKDIHELCTTRGANGRLKSPKLMAPKLPQFIIPTTPTTATVKAGAAILNPETNEMLSTFDPKNRACGVFIHPDFVVSAPEGLVLNAGLSTLACAIDGLLSAQGDPMADAQLIQAVRILMKALSNRERLADSEVRCELLLAAALCGQGSDFTGFGLTIALGHAICAHYPVPDGYMNAITLPHSLRFNDGYGDGMEKLAFALKVQAEDGVSFTGAVIEKVEQMLADLPVPKRFGETDIAREKISAIAASAMDDWYLHLNPRPVSRKDIEELMECGW